MSQQPQRLKTLPLLVDIAMQTGELPPLHPQNPSLILELISPPAFTSLQLREQRASIISAVKSFADTPAPIAAETLRQIIAFENKLYPLMQADKHWFFSLANKTEALQFARDIFLLHSVAAHTLERLLERRGEWANSDSDVLLHEVIAFALYHHGAAIKWSFFRHEPVKATVWPQLHRLFLFAEQNYFATVSVRLFEDEAQYPTSAQSLYIRALLLEVLNTGSLTIEQVEIADGWLAEWSPDYLFDTAYLPRAHSLFVDLNAGTGLQLANGNTAKPSYRYLRMDSLKNQVEAIRTELRAGRPYHGRGTSNVFSMEQHVALLSTIERLYQTLLNASASRIEERTPVNNLLADIRLDFNDALAAVSGEEKPAISAEAAAQNTRWTRWRVHDISSKGVGLLVDRATGERVSVGQLLTIKPDGLEHWMMGVIVRKLTQRTVGETLLGVEILCYRPLPVTLTRYAHVRDVEPDPGVTPVRALYLPGGDADGKADILVMPAADFQLKNVFSLAAKKNKFRVRINRVLRKGGDWVGLRFEVIGKQ